MEKENLFKVYSQWKKNRVLLAHELVRFEGVSDDEVIESMCFSKPEGERIQTSGITDTTGKTAIYYRKVAETLNDDWYDFLFRQYQDVKEEIDFFEAAVNQLSGRLPQVVYDMVVMEMSWKELAGKYQVSEAMLAKYRKKALGELDDIYQLRNSHMEQFLLS
ncbi:hypothetical protein ACG0Z4_05610 [Enterocloster aldenensis]|uniref:hypothetical protein n=1 Tax=Enterocloster aldenensis TaxID=358742 RepID=UPI0040282855